MLLRGLSPQARRRRSTRVHRAMRDAIVGPEQLSRAADWSIRRRSSGARKRRAAQRQMELGGVHQTLCAGARQTELGLRELTLRVDHVNDTGIAKCETAAGEVERRHGRAHRFLLGAKLVGIVGEGLQLPLTTKCVRCVLARSIR